MDILRRRYTADEEEPADEQRVAPLAAAQADARAADRRAEIQGDDAVRLVSWRLNTILGGDSAEVGIARIPEVFTPDCTFVVGPEVRDLDWLRAYIRDEHMRLKDLRVEVTHAVRNGDTMADRHFTTATNVSTGRLFRYETIAFYELSNEGLYRRVYELSAKHEGEYGGT